MKKIKGLLLLIAIMLVSVISVYADESEEIAKLVPTIEATEITENSISVKATVEHDIEGLDEVMCAIYRADTENGDYKNITMDGYVNCSGALSFVDKDLNSNTTYYYKAIVEGGTNYSEVISVTTKDGKENTDNSGYVLIEKNLKQIQLIRYTGNNNAYRIRKITGNTSVMHNILNILNKNEKIEKEVTKNAKLTNLELSYSNSNDKVVIIFYGDNVVGITDNSNEEKIYKVNYDGDVEEKIINLYSFFTVPGENDITNPSTSDNTLVIISLALVALGVSIVAFRKRKLS